MPVHSSVDREDACADAVEHEEVRARCGGACVCLAVSTVPTPAVDLAARRHATHTPPMPRPAFTDGQRHLARLRLAGQLLGAERAESPAEAVRWMLALQAQDFPGVKWSVGLRTAGATERDVETALDAGRLVRSWPMRGTLHLVTARDLPWMLELTASRSIVSAARRRAVLGITEADIERARETAIDSLTGGRALARANLLGAIQAGGVSTAGQRGYHLLWYLAQTGTLVMGGTDARGQTYALLDEWVGDRLRFERDEALGELARRYFASHGPATVADLVRWSGLTVRDVRRGLEVAGEALTTIEVESVTYNLSPETLGAPVPATGVLLLPGFDEYVLGYRDRSAALAPEHNDAIVPGGNGMFKATIVVDGEIVGTWSRRATSREVVVEPAPFDESSPEREGLVAAAERYGRFLGRRATVGTRRSVSVTDRDVRSSPNG